MKTVSFVGLSMAALAVAGIGHLVSASEQPRWEEQLGAFEQQLLDGRTPGTPADERRRGAEPWRIVSFEDPPRSVVLMRHTSEAVLLDGQFRPVDRVPLPRSPAAAVRLTPRLLLVGGELSNRLALLEVGADSIEISARAELPGAVAVKDLAVDSGRLFVLDDFQRRLLIVDLDSGDGDLKLATVRSIDMGPGLQRAIRIGERLLVHVQHSHELLVLPLDDPDPASPRSLRISFRAPLMSVTAARWGSEIWLAAAGIENRPLDRLSGEFGYVDSFLYLLRLGEDPAGNPVWKDAWWEDANRFTSLNLSAFDVVSPKSLLAVEGQTPTFWVAGYGSGRVACIRKAPAGWRVAASWPAPPGISDLAPGQGTALLAASPLADSVFQLSPTGALLGSWRAPDPLARDADERLGELLLLTTLMSPHNQSTGQLSKLTCEACHLDGGIDGRVHFTGRGDVHATTKTLRGMADNVPLFSRGGDPDFASMVPAEFDAVNQGRHSVFTLSRAEIGWLENFPDIDPIISPEKQRQALLTFLLRFDHRPNPWRLSREGLDVDARAGLTVFRDRCEHCHQARTTTRRPTPVRFEQWPAWLEGERDLVWGAPFFSKTGIRPYVDPAGARVPSLRRVWLKSPYFTNGSAATMTEVLERFRYRDFEAWHYWEGETEGGAAALSKSERAQLEALLKYF